jgi:molybdenum cofactor guanylyltransferase
MGKPNNLQNRRPLFILCGGDSRRFGKDKALLKIGEETFLEHLIGRTESFFSDIALLGDGRSYDRGLPAFKDAIPGSGPLGGLLQAMNVSKEETFAMLPVDSPVISERLIRVLASHLLPEDADGAIVQSSGSVYPLTGIFRTRLESALKERLSKGQYKVLDFIRSIHTEAIPCRDDEIWNINTPEERARAEADARRRTGTDPSGPYRGDAQRG